MQNDYPDVSLYIDGQWLAPHQNDRLDVLNPATGERLGKLSCASLSDLDQALDAADRGFTLWRMCSALDRGKIMRRTAELLRARTEQIATLMTLEEGKPLAESRMELAAAAETLEWFAEEARRAYGRVIPARTPNIQQLALKEPVGPIAAFTPWNFPVNQAMRKVAAALAAGCSVILKGPEETPASCAAMVRAFADSGLPAGVLNLVFGNPAEISGHLIPHPVIRKISFTGSTAVGKHLSALAGQHMKRATMELGGHAPAIICDDADIAAAVAVLCGAKFRNAGQVCTTPTRFLVQDAVHDTFLEQFINRTKAITVGNGLDAATIMGPLANKRRVDAMEALVADAVGKGAKLKSGGCRVGNAGNFYEPTVLSDVPLDALAMNQEPFGPIALVRRFHALDEAIMEANRLPYGLAAFAFANATSTISQLTSGVATGMLSVNHNGLGMPENPFGGVRDSGYGSEGGVEAMEGYLNTKFVTISA
jgi:succinate-semialdehyde dehydrogenase/glutarate-semialdehyde dehydrogenase